MQHVTEDVGQAEIATARTVGKLFVVDSQLVQCCCPQVIDRANVLYGVIAEFVSRTVGSAALDASAGQPY